VCRTLEGGKTEIPDELMTILRTLPAAEGTAA